ncbi:hypothetical protein CPB84DRAFT_1856154 [Gymnopilus junonius]|uniref:Uncharacterized protein n=1 Tax=Gymnopilus junonius TaxID=109634 RepID=A0A9P5N802_GYMJU|nr:hypothetical protein CPB84DRAFT_1856154 [Gymnopilus junonius]
MVIHILSCFCSQSVAANLLSYRVSADAAIDSDIQPCQTWCSTHQAIQQASRSLPHEDWAAKKFDFSFQVPSVTRECTVTPNAHESLWDIDIHQPSHIYRLLGINYYSNQAPECGTPGPVEERLICWIPFGQDDTEDFLPLPHGHVIPCALVKKYKLVAKALATSPSPKPPASLPPHAIDCSDDMQPPFTQPQPSPLPSVDKCEHEQPQLPSTQEESATHKEQEPQQHDKAPWQGHEEPQQQDKELEQQHEEPQEGWEEEEEELDMEMQAEESTFDGEIGQGDEDSSKDNDAMDVDFNLDGLLNFPDKPG